MKGRRWAEEHDTMIILGVADNMSHAQIAAAINARFGTNFTRNACLGRAHRLGIKSQLGPSSGAYHHKPRPPRIIIPKVRVSRRIKAEVMKLRCVEVDPLHVSLIDLQPGCCRYPFGDGPFTFCGHPQEDGKPYCAPHWALAMPIATVGQTRAERELRIRAFAKADKERRTAEVAA